MWIHLKNVMLKFKYERIHRVNISLIAFLETFKIIGTFYGYTQMK